MESLFGLVVIIGFWYLLSTSINSHRIKVKRDNLKRLLTKELDGYNISTNEINWLYEIIDNLPENEIDETTKEFNNDPKVATKAEVERLHAEYNKREQLQKTVRDCLNNNEKWNSYIENFRLLNKSQQGHEIKRLKNDADSLIDIEKINLLELINLDNSDEITDLVIGGVKILSIRNKK